MNILDNDLVLKYFPCPEASWNNHNPAHWCDATRAKLVLASTQQPIKAGERYLFVQSDGNVRELTMPLDLQHVQTYFHPQYLRLPDRYQPKDTGPITCGECKRPFEMGAGKTEPSKRARPMTEQGIKESKIVLGKADPECSCGHMGRCPGCAGNMFSTDPVEEKIEQIARFYITQGSFIDIREYLRALVALARTQ
jgi:hypothetical protein